MKISNTQYLTRTAMLLALVVVFQNLRLIPFIGGNQMVSLFLIGSLVNLTLIMACEFVGFWGAFVVSVLSSVIALTQGHIPFLPMMPLVAIGNIILIGMYALVKNFNKYVALAVGALLKWGFLFYSITWALQILIKPSLPPKISIQQFNKMYALLSFSFNYPQAITALVGGILAIFISKYVNKSQGA